MTSFENGVMVSCKDSTILGEDEQSQQKQSILDSLTRAEELNEDRILQIYNCQFNKFTQSTSNKPGQLFVKLQDMPYHESIISSMLDPANVSKHAESINNENSKPFERTPKPTNRLNEHFQ